jgi:RNA polymerase sigma-70 factor (ECF subfamily)
MSRRAQYLERAWMQASPYQIAHELATNPMYRQTIDYPRSWEEELIDPVTAPDMETENNLAVEQLRLALRHLTHDQREVIFLRFNNGLSIADIAQTLNKSEGAVRNLQLRALKTLQRQLLKHSTFHAFSD